MKADQANKTGNNPRPQLKQVKPTLRSESQVKAKFALFKNMLLM